MAYSIDHLKPTRHVSPRQHKSLSFYSSNVKLTPPPPRFVAGPRGGVRSLRPRPAARPVRQPRATPLRQERRHRAPAARRRASGRGTLLRRGARGVGAGVRLQGVSLGLSRSQVVVGEVVWSATVRCDMWCLLLAAVRRDMWCVLLALLGVDRQ